MSEAGTQSVGWTLVLTGRAVFRGASCSEWSVQDGSDTVTLWHSVGVEPVANGDPCMWHAGQSPR